VIISKCSHWNNIKCKYSDKHNRLLITTLLKISVTIPICVLLFPTGHLKRFESSPEWEFSTVTVGPLKNFHIEQIGRFACGMWRDPFTTRTTTILITVRIDYLQYIRINIGVVPQLNHEHRLTSSIPFTFNCPSVHLTIDAEMLKASLYKSINNVTGSGHSFQVYILVITLKCQSASLPDTYLKAEF